VSLTVCVLCPLTRLQVQLRYSYMRSESEKELAMSLFVSESGRCFHMN